MYKFKIVDEDNGEFRVQFLYDNEVLMSSETYRARGSAYSVVDAIQRGMANAAIYPALGHVRRAEYQFQIARSKNNRFFSRLVAPDGEVLMTSELLLHHRDAQRSAEIVKQYAPNAPLEESGVNDDETRNAIIRKLSGNAEVLRGWAASLDLAIADVAEEMQGAIPNDPEHLEAYHTFQTFLSDVRQDLKAVRGELKTGLIEASPADKERAVGALEQLSETVEIWLKNHQAVLIKIRRIGIIGLACSFLVACGVPGPAAAAIAVAVLEGGDILEAIKKIR